MKKNEFNYILIFFGILFSFARVLRNSDYFLVIGYSAMLWLIIKNYKIFYDDNFKHNYILFALFIVWVYITSFWAESSIVTMLQSTHLLLIGVFAILVVSFTIKKKIIEKNLEDFYLFQKAIKHFLKKI